jgi:hypothetical protein
MIAVEEVREEDRLVCEENREAEDCMLFCTC